MKLKHQFYSEAQNTQRMQSGADVLYDQKVNEIIAYELSGKKRYKSCHWGCTFSKGTLFYLKDIGTLMYLKCTY